MKYNGSDYHKENCLKASKLGLLKQQELKKERISEYYSNPKKCLCCNKPIDYDHKNQKKFCNPTCAAKINNKNRIVSDDTKQKIRTTLKKKYNSGELIPQNNESRILNSKKTGCCGNSCKIKYTNCKICDKMFITKTWSVRTTCSKDCRTIASTKVRTYQNGSRKPQWYYNKWEDKNVLLESSWETQTAELLDEKNIKWTRPKPISWIDLNNKSHLYFPDFLLIDYDYYLDPKNPYCMEKDKEKMSQISQKVNIIYGDIKIVITYINNLITSTT